MFRGVETARTRILVALVSVIALLGVMFVMPATSYADPAAPEVESQTELSGRLRERRPTTSSLPSMRESIPR